MWSASSPFSGWPPCGYSRAGAADVLLSRQGAVVSVATVDPDRALDRLWLDPDLDRMGAVGTPLRFDRRDPAAFRRVSPPRQRLDPAAGGPVSAGRSRRSGPADRLRHSRRGRGQAGRDPAQTAGAETS